MKLMTVMTHPDDAAIWVGGTILKHIAKGDECLHVSLTGKGDIQSEAQSARASEILSSPMILLDLASASPPIPNDVFQSLLEIIIGFRPETIITHWNKDTHPRHVYAFELVQRAIVKSKINFNELDERITPLQTYMCDSYYSVGHDTMSFQPSHLIDISDVFEKKMAAIDCFADQYLPLWQKMSRIMAEFYGGKCGCTYAEALSIAGSLASLGGGHQKLPVLPG